ncbi:Cation transporting ATPase [Aspergillus sclerotialis]|uniref:Calcium-transporting ATPase 2 n=1 Tax=Aspergillus sclerotialis TaxID=2070753 RepID=A0A3A2ZEA9_9EURO|nr:Cation transporting ATPase [Aspergillus sclerotialis]
MAKTTAPFYIQDNMSEALAPDPRNEADFQVQDNKFAFSPGQLNKLLNPKSLAAFYAVGGLQGLEFGLQTDLKAGLSTDETVVPGYVTFEQVHQDAAPTEKASQQFIENASVSPPGESLSAFCDRIRIFGRNVVPEARRKGFLGLLWDAYNDKIIILLTIAAVVSLSLGIYEAVSGQSQVDWIEGVAVCVAILIVVLATAGNDWQKSRQFAKLNKRKTDRQVRVIRSGRTDLVHISELTVGDVVHLEAGDSAPCDGVIITNHGIKCDESSATGESDHIQKVSGFEAWNNISSGISSDDVDPFIISGSKVLEGLGTYLVTSVGTHSTYGRIMSALGTDSDPTPLQVKLARLASWIGWFGLSAALLLFIVLFIRFLAQMPGNNATPTKKGQEFMDILIIAVTVIVVAIPEGLPLAVTLALAFATARMLKENNLVRLLRACETMGNATVICSDKTGTLTENKMTVVAGFFGISEHFGELSASALPPKSTVTVPEVLQRFPGSFSKILRASLTRNSTAFEVQNEDGVEFSGNKTEVALLQFAKNHLGLLSLAEDQANLESVHVYPFDSVRKAMAVVYITSTGYRLLVKGAAELILEPCTEVVLADGSDLETVARRPIQEEDRRTMSDTIDKFAETGLRTIGVAYRDFQVWPPEKGKTTTDGTPSFEMVLRDLTWIGAFGIQDPLRPEVTDAIRTCRAAGVQVKMVTGDNIGTAQSIAKSCGIKTDDGVIMQGSDFRKLGKEELDRVIPRLQVLARSSPDDKRLLVEQLKHLGEIVAVTGDGTNDGPALKSADVGFSMGISGTEVSKEASSIVLLDDNFKSIVTAIAWGRSVNDAVAKFLQFQITVNITAVLITVVTAIYNSENKSVFKAIQLLWLNLIMDTFAALAL